MRDIHGSYKGGGCKKEPVEKREKDSKLTWHVNYLLTWVGANTNKCLTALTSKALDSTSGQREWRKEVGCGHPAPSHSGFYSCELLAPLRPALASTQVEWAHYNLTPGHPNLTLCSLFYFSSWHCQINLVPNSCSQS